VQGEVLAEITPGGTIRQVYKSEPEAEASGIAVPPNGDVWFDLSASGDQLERLSPSGMATSFPLTSAFEFGAGRLAAGPGGTIWFTTDQAIGRLMPSGAQTRFPLPHRLAPNDIVAAPNGDIWFDATVGVEAVSVHDYIGRITSAGGLKLYRIPTLGTEPKGLVLSPDGNIWFAARGAIERLTPRGHFTRFSMPFPGSQPPGDGRRQERDLVHRSRDKQDRLHNALRQADRIPQL
jgi:virginiamycin B lyase